jgi:tRNA (guanine37-N1)-methyltransferase
MNDKYSLKEKTNSCGYANSLDAFVAAFSDIDVSELDTLPPIQVHSHCFTRQPEGEAAEKDILQRTESALGFNIATFQLHYVRKVAPNKDMYCISFALPTELVER